MARVDLLVTNYNTRDKLQRLLDTLHSDYKPRIWKLYIADNGSTDDSLDWLMYNKCKYQIEHIYKNANIGYANACNLMAGNSNSDGLAMLNADTWMTTQDVDLLTMFMLNYDNVGVVGPKARDEQGRITHGGVFGSNVMPKMRGWMNPDPDDVLYRQRDKCVTVSGSAYFIPRWVWNEMAECPIYAAEEAVVNSETPGAFLPTPHYYEETFFSYHCRAHGYDVWYDGTVSTGHTWHASSPKGGFADKHFHASRALFRNACANHNIDCD